MCKRLDRLRLVPVLIWLHAVASHAVLLSGADCPTNDAQSGHWSFQKPTRPTVPSVRHADRVRTPIDAFVVDKLEQKRLTFSSEADRATLLRRAHLDLTGVPPTLEQLDGFLADDRADAYDRLLDQL